MREIITRITALILAMLITLPMTARALTSESTEPDEQTERHTVYVKYHSRLDTL